MAFKDGDFLEVEYTLWSDADARVLESTNEKVAKEANIYSDKVKYEPILVILGSGAVVKGMESALMGMDLNTPKKFSLKPADAFGERNADLVRVMPLSEFKKHDINPYPGMRLKMDNMTITVKSINSGRVVVDANHPYAGMAITYELKVVKNITSEDEKIKILGKTYGAEPSEVKISGSQVQMVYKDSVQKNADYFVGKANAIASAFTYINSIDSVKVIEEYSKPKEHKHEEEQ